MEIPGWAYISVGVVVAGIAGYVYRFIPKDGAPNMSMAVFFFVGMVFILVGIVKLFFKQIDAPTQNAATAPIHHTKQEQEHHVNRVEQQIGKIYAQQTQHTSNYAQQHPYSQGQQHVQHQAMHHTQPATHQPMSQRIQQVHHSQPPQQPTYVKCHKCGTTNHSVSNYCHVCGNRLK